MNSTDTQAGEKMVSHVLESEKGELPSEPQPIEIIIISAFERRDATDEEIKTLRHVIDHLPLAVWIVAFAGAAERFTYYAITAPWRKPLLFIPQIPLRIKYF